MKRKRLRFPGFAIQVDPRWSDTTETLDDPNAPFTVEDRKNGVGALQFSVARYRSGEIPNPGPDDLLDLVRDFGKRRVLGPAADEATFQNKIVGAGASFHCKDDFIRVWYVSDGKSFLLITYLCEWPNRLQEQEEYERIVREVQFTPATEKK